MDSNETTSSSRGYTPKDKNYRSVQWRIMLRQIPLMLVLFVALLYWLENHLREALTIIHLESAQNSSLLIVSAVETSMRTTDFHHVWDQLEQRLPRSEGLHMEILSKDGRVIYATDPELRGTTRSLSEATCTACHLDGTKKATSNTKFIDGPEGTQFQLFAATLRNSEDCVSCHADDGPKLGMIYQRKSLETVHSLIGTTKLALIIAGTITFLLTVLTTRIFMGRYLNQPLRQLVAGARAIGTGDHYEEIHLPERTELSILADTMNISEQKLKENIQQLKNKQDDLTHLYHIADHFSQSIKPDQSLRHAVELVRTVFEADCLIIAGHFDPNTHTFHGTLTYRDTDGRIVERPFSEADAKDTVPFYSSTIVDKWMYGELDGVARIREDSLVAYPIERHGLRLGIILAPARRRSESTDGRPTAANPKVVQAFIKHLAIALELSELQRARIREERLAAIGETVAGLAHCLKNTLNGLRGGEYVIESGMKKKDTNKLRKGWNLIKNGVRHIERLSLDMLYYAGEHVPQLGEVNPNEILQDVIDLLSESASAQGVRLQAQVDEGMEKIPLDRLSIYRAVLNLVTNAIDACLESETGDTVVLKSELEEENVLIIVKDNGIGMPELVAERIFERFFTTKPSRGTGLGLPVVKKIVESHGGTIELASTPGEGTVFTIRLPRKAEGSS